MLFNNFGGPEVKDSNALEFSGRQSFRGLSTSLASLSSSESFRREFEPLLFIDRITDIADTEDAIKYCRLRLSSRTSTPTALGAFSILAQRAFLWTDNINYINEAIHEEIGRGTCMH